MILRAIRIAACCVPYAFLFLYGDAEYGTMLAALFVAAACLLLFFRMRHISLMLFAGHALSFLSSCLCLHFLATEKWTWYFKPFSAFQLMCALSLAGLALHLLMCRHKK